MIQILLLFPFATPPADLAPAAPVVAPLQDEDLKAKFKSFEEILKSKAREGEAIGLLDEFVKAYRITENRISSIDDSLDLGDGDAKELKAQRKALVKEQEEIAEVTFSCFHHKSRKAMTEANMQMWKAAAYSLGQMGPLGGQYLWKVFEDKKKKFRKEPDFLGLCLQQVGYTHAYEAFTGELVDLLDHHEYLFIAKAAEALAQFGEAPGALRKDAVETTVKLLAEYYEATISDKEDIEAQEKYRKVGRPMMNALEALTGVSQSQPLDWVAWWNKNKKDKEIWADA